MKPRRYDQLWNRWLLIDSGVTFEEWLDSLRERRKQMPSSPMGLMVYHQQQAMHGMMGLGGLLGAGIQSIGQIGMSLKRSY